MRTTAETSSSSEAARTSIAPNSVSAATRVRQTVRRSFRITAPWRCRIPDGAILRSSSDPHYGRYSEKVAFDALRFEQRQAIGAGRLWNRLQIRVDIGEIGVGQHRLAIG